MIFILILPPTLSAARRLTKRIGSNVAFESPSREAYVAGRARAMARLIAVSGVAELDGVGKVTRRWTLTAAYRTWPARTVV